MNVERNSLKIQLKFNGNFNEILMEIHFNSVEISMKHQFKFQRNNEVAISMKHQFFENAVKIHFEIKLQIEIGKRN